MLKKNLTAGEGFKILILSNEVEYEIKYNGNIYNEKSDNGKSSQKIQNSLYTVYSGTIRSYSNTGGALKLYIPSEKLVNNCAPRLHFLYTQNGETYQYSTIFNIQPKYQTSQKVEDVIVNDYLKLVKAKTIAEDGKVEEAYDETAYYVTSLRFWGNSVKLTPTNVTNGQTKNTEHYLFDKDLPYSRPHEYTFMLQGSAFVNEFGMVTTNTNFDLDAHTITVDVYQKVSGFNGMYEEDNTNPALHLGTYRLRFAKYESLYQYDYGVISQGIPNENSKNYSSNTFSSNRYEILTIPRGYKVFLTKTSDYDLYYTIQDTINLSKNTFSVEQNSVVNFHDWFDGEESLKDIFNKKYHLVQMKQGDNIIDIFHTTNIDQYMFGTQGSFELQFVVTGRSPKKDDNDGFDQVRILLTTNVLVYQSSSQQARFVTVETESDSADYDLQNLDKNVSDWYKVEGNGVKKITENDEKQRKVNLSKGVQRMQFVGTNGNSQRAYDVTFLVYNSGENVDKSVVLSPNQRFDLSNLLDAGQSGQFYSIISDIKESGGSSDVMPIEAEILQGEANGAIKTYNYVFVSSDETTVTRYKVDFKVQGANSSDRDVFSEFADETIEQNNVRTISADNVTAKVLEVMKATDNKFKIEDAAQLKEGEQLSIFEIGNNGVMTEVKDGYKLVVPNGSYYIQKYFLVQYKNAGDDNTVCLRRISVTFYLYEGASEGDGIYQLTRDVPEMSYLNMHDLDSWVTEQISIKAGSEANISGAVSYFKLNDNGKLTNFESISSLLKNFNEKLYVRIGNRYFLVNLTLNVN